MCASHYNYCIACWYFFHYVNLFLFLSVQSEFQKYFKWCRHTVQYKSNVYTLTIKASEWELSGGEEKTVVAEQSKLRVDSEFSWTTSNKKGKPVKSISFILFMEGSRQVYQEKQTFLVLNFRKIILQIWKAGLLFWYHLNQL